MDKRGLGWMVTVACAAVFILTGAAPAQMPETSGEEVHMEASEFSISSSAFVNGARIPDRYTCSGDDQSPPLAWKGAPDGTAAFALVCDDPDAPGGTWVHWVIYNIPFSVQSLPMGVVATASLPDGTRQGKNSFNVIGYRGPCPPKGHGDHRYYFKLYALRKMLDLPSGATKAQLMAAMEDRVVGEANIMGSFSR